MSIHPKPLETPVAGNPAVAPSPPSITASIVNPYSAPPPPPRPARPATVSSLLRLLISAATASLVLAATVVYVVWLVSGPLPPMFSVSSASLLTDSLTTSFDVTFAVRSFSHSSGIRYTEAEASVTYGGGDSVVAKSALPPLHQGSDSSIFIRARFVAEGTRVLAAIADDRAVKGIVEFGFGFRAVAYFRSSALRPKRHLLMVHCCDVPFGFTNSTAAVLFLSGPQRPCKVELP
ncbi:hypothetical protein QJS04_geneDACA012456 [Acorus gramineus]|uniref:Late embryogenesis abundant protein LEA-2 subgroup domain-containing protein n=1 Tax=Acorus gramineus TaxID=55184 RepID=A0AAV9B9C2_ACOGR|nr:hypothetical protein QJS04_geneDACA012456 [Acorus gramineus]